jgi:26S proteasome regulatory subunit N6
MKKMDDKQMLVEIQLIESKVHHALENLPKAKAALTSVKTASHSIYVVPHLQAEIDMQSGIICAEENDFNTGYSYFYECFEGYNSFGDENARKALKYMMLAKIMNKASDEALNLVNNIAVLKYVNRDIEAMKEVAKASKAQSL